MATMTQTRRLSSQVACPQPYVVAYGFRRTRERHARTPPISLQPHSAQGDSLWFDCLSILSGSPSCICQVFPSTHINVMHPQNPLKWKSTDL